ncbi:hypothetical protein ACLOJK_017491, partial [Asimina triloba]
GIDTRREEGEGQESEKRKVESPPAPLVEELMTMWERKTARGERKRISSAIHPQEFVREGRKKAIERESLPWYVVCREMNDEKREKRKIENLLSYGDRQRERERGDEGIMKADAEGRRVGLAEELTT